MKGVLSDKERLFIEKCPHCGSEDIQFTSSKVIYGRCYGMVYLCSQCKAFVGCHNGTKRPLGRLANEQDRKLRKLAHALFDPIWQDKELAPEKPRKINRHLAYKRMAEILDIPIEDAHISQVSEAQLKKLIRSLWARRMKDHDQEVLKDFYNHYRDGFSRV